MKFRNWKEKDRTKSCWGSSKNMTASNFHYLKTSTHNHHQSNLRLHLLHLYRSSNTYLSPLLNTFDLLHNILFCAILSTILSMWFSLRISYWIFCQQRKKLMVVMYLPNRRWCTVINLTDNVLHSYRTSLQETQLKSFGLPVIIWPWLPKAWKVVGAV